MFPIKQKLNLMAAFFMIKMFKTGQFFDSPLCSLCTHQACCTTIKKISKLDQIETFGLPKKAAVRLIGIIYHNFLVPRMIELAPQDFHDYSDPRSTQCV